MRSISGVPCKISRDYHILVINRCAIVINYVFASECNKEATKDGREDCSDRYRRNLKTVSLRKIIHDEIIGLSSTQLSTMETWNTQQLECHSSLTSRHSEPDSSMNQTKFERGDSDAIVRHAG